MGHDGSVQCAVLLFREVFKKKVCQSVTNEKTRPGGVNSIKPKELFYHVHIFIRDHGSQDNAISPMCCLTNSTRMR